MLLQKIIGKKSYLVSNLLWSISYVAIILIIFATIETIFIYPPVVSYNIGPPFFWFLMISPGILLGTFILVALFKFLYRKLTVNLSNKIRGLFERFALLISCIISILFLIIVVFTYRDFFPEHITQRVFGNLGCLNVFYIASLVIVNYLISNLVNKHGIKLWKVSFVACIIAVAIGSIWWYMMGFWGIGN